MAIQTPAYLKSRFAAVPERTRITEQDWTDLFDTLAHLEALAGGVGGLWWRRDRHDSSTKRLGAAHLRFSAMGVWQVSSDGGQQLLKIDADGPGLSYPESPIITDVTLGLAPHQGNVDGRTVTCWLRNEAVSPITLTLGPDMIGVNAVWPIVLSAGDFLSLSVTFLSMFGANSKILVSVVQGREV
jgi:hypothetical protein